MKSSPAKTILVSVPASWQRTSVLMHPCTCHPFRPCPHFLPPSPSPWKRSISPALCWAWCGLAKLTVARPCSGRRLDAASSPSKPAAAVTPLDRATAEDLWWGRWTAFHPSDSHHPPQSLCEKCVQKKPHDKDIQHNILPSRSPPDLTSWLLKLPDQKQHRLPVALERD